MAKIRIAVRIATAALTFALVGAPANASGFVCHAVKVIQLTPTPDGAALHLRGRAEIDECFGLSFLHVVVRGGAPANTTLYPVFPGRQPIIGEAFNFANGKAETVSPDIFLNSITGRPFSVTDTNFTELLTGQF